MTVARTVEVCVPARSVHGESLRLPLRLRLTGDKAELVFGGWFRAIVELDDLREAIELLERDRA